VDDILASILIDRARPVIIARNGHGAQPDEEVLEGDRILVCPIFSGG
jgi:sulfur carrier protein ThiS